MADLPREASLPIFTFASYHALSSYGMYECHAFARFRIGFRKERRRVKSLRLREGMSCTKPGKVPRKLTCSKHSRARSVFLWGTSGWFFQREPRKGGFRLESFPTLSPDSAQAGGAVLQQHLGNHVHYSHSLKAAKT